MRPPKRNKRLMSLGLCGVFLSAGTFLILTALGQNVSYFYTPIQIENGDAAAQKRIRLGGLVAEGSVVRGAGTETVFRVTDGAAEVTVRYTGILPDLFREGQGVIAQGEFGEGHIFNAGTILAKHDENYKPKELVDGLKDAEAYTSSSNYSTDVPLSDVNTMPVSYAVNQLSLASQRGHVSKTFIREDCSIVNFKVDLPVTGAAFITYADNLEPVFLALSHGNHGASLYDPTGTRVWHIAQQVDVVSSFGDHLLMYREDANGSVLERVKLDLRGQMGEPQIESPSEIAPTTLQRSSISSMGPVLFKENGILFETSFVKLKSRPTAIAATKSAFGPTLANGAVAMGLKNGDIQIWDAESVSSGCSKI